MSNEFRNAIKEINNFSKDSPFMLLIYKSMFISLRQMLIEMDKKGILGNAYENISTLDAIINKLNE